MNQCFDLCGLSCSSEEIKTSLTISDTRFLPTPPPAPYMALKNMALVDATDPRHVSAGQWGSSGRPQHSEGWDRTLPCRDRLCPDPSRSLGSSPSSRQASGFAGPEGAGGAEVGRGLLPAPRRRTGSGAGVGLGQGLGCSPLAAGRRGAGAWGEASGGVTLSVCRNAAVVLLGGEGQLPGEVQRQRLGVQHPSLVQGAGAGPGRVEHGQLGDRQAGFWLESLHHGHRLAPAARQARRGLQAVPLGRRRAVVLEPHCLHLL